MVSSDWMLPQDNLRVLSLRTPTLPPATHTNTSFVGRERVWIVDPATPYPDERARLLDAVACERAAGRELAGIVLTHHHHDHVGGADWLRGETGLAVWAHPRTEELLQGRLTIDVALDEGDVLTGSEASDDAWHVLHTPGHASGHIVLFQPESRALVAGDMVAAVGTILVEPPDGNMAQYISELRRLLALEPRIAVPAHGEVIGDPAAHFGHYISHRLAREAKVLAAVHMSPRALLEITRDAYDDVPESLHLLASRSTLAHLFKLRDEARVMESSTGAWRRSPGVGSAPRS